jgi:hypothetical protein
VNELAKLAARKHVLLSELELQRMQMSLHASDARAALRPSGLIGGIGGAIARPAALIALLDPIARLFGWRRMTRLVRIAALALAAYRVARVWRTRVPASPPPPV